MKINAIANNSNNTSFQKGLYFTNHPTILFDKTATLKGVAKNSLATSNEGFKYVKNSTLPKDIKERIQNSPFVKELAEKFDTFIHIRKPFKSPYFDKNYAPLKIQWFDSSKGTVQRVDILGNDAHSKKQAVNNMLHNLETKNFF